MLRDAAVDLLMARLGKRRDTTLKDSIIGEMVFVQETLLEGNATLLWFLLSSTTTVVTVADDESITLPSDFLQEWESGGLYIQNTDGTEKELIRDDWDIIKSEANVVGSNLSGTAKPTHYDLAGDSILLRAIPDAVYSIKFRFYARQTSLTGVYGDAANIENNWLKHASDWLIAETGVIIAGQYLQSSKMVGVFQTQAQTALDRLIKKNTAFEESNKTRRMDA